MQLIFIKENDIIYFNFSLCICVCVCVILSLSLSPPSPSARLALVSLLLIWFFSFFPSDFLSKWIITMMIIFGVASDEAPPALCWHSRAQLLMPAHSASCINPLNISIWLQFDQLSVSILFFLFFFHLFIFQINNKLKKKIEI